MGVGVDVWLYDQGAQASGRLLGIKPRTNGIAQDNGAKHGSQEHPAQAAGSAISQLPYHDVSDEQPKGSAPRTRPGVPAHPVRNLGKSVAQIQPRKAKGPVVVQDFDGQPTRYPDPEGRADADLACGIAVKGPDAGHEGSVDEHRPKDARPVGARDPPGGSEVKQRHAGVGPPGKLAEFAATHPPFEHEHRYHRNPQQWCQNGEFVVAQRTWPRNA